MRRIVLVACGSQKLSHPAAAELLYTGHLFRLRMAYAKKLRPDAIYILSAKHGLLGLDELIAPYNANLNDASRDEAREWAQRVLGQLRLRSDLTKDHFVLLAGDAYLRGLLPYLRSHDVPLRCLRLGPQKHRLMELIDE